MMRIGLVIPSYNESERLPSYIEGFLNQVDYLKSNNLFLHILIVDDGSKTADWTKTEASLEQLFNKSTDPQTLKIEWLRREKNFGKGYSLKQGFLQLRNAQLDVLGFADADGAVNAIDTIQLAEELKNPNVDIVIGSRWKALGYKIERSFKRHLSGRIFVTLLNHFFNIPVYDSQCGAKFFKMPYFKHPDLFEICDNTNWFFDTQLLIVAYRAHYTIHEVPVNWIDQVGSKVSLIKDSLRMFSAMIAFKNKLERIKIAKK